jgi:hypothetical protein
MGWGMGDGGNRAALLDARPGHVDKLVSTRQSPGAGVVNLVRDGELNGVGPVEFDELA